ncbi:hypothetical protein, conserved in T. vivax, partial [Trypanosoma vivax Y486]
SHGVRCVRTSADRACLCAASFGNAPNTAAAASHWSAGDGQANARKTRADSLFGCRLWRTSVNRAHKGKQHAVSQQSVVFVSVPSKIFTLSFCLSTHIFFTHLYLFILHLRHYLTFFIAHARAHSQRAVSCLLHVGLQQLHLTTLYIAWPLPTSVWFFALTQSVHFLLLPLPK